jgi:plastocyanin
MKKSAGPKNRLLYSIAIVLTILSVTVGCKKSIDNMYGTSPTTSTGTTTGPGTNEVWIQGMAFTPVTITVTAGTTIVWTNKDAVVHNVTSTTGLFSSGSMLTNATYSRTFSTAGTFPYTCTIHPTMTGTVVVN